MAKFTIRIPKSLISYCDFRDKINRTTDGIGACDLLYGLMMRTIMWAAIIALFLGITLASGGVYTELVLGVSQPPSWALMLSALPYTTSLLVAGFAISGLCKYVDFTGR